MSYIRSLNRFTLVSLVLLGFSTSSVNAVVLTFEDVPDGSLQNQYGDMPTYYGFVFSSTLDWIDVRGAHGNYGAYSGQYAILNNLSGMGIITDAGGADFTFDGLWAKKWGELENPERPDSLFGSLSGYNNGNEVWNIETGLNGSYEFYGAQLGLIDELRLDFGNNFLVDDISLNSSYISPVPVPAAAWLFGTALIGLAGLSRRRKDNVSVTRY
jgi:hypothetical protein